MARSRREFLRQAACGMGAAALLAGLDRFGAIDAFAQGRSGAASDYKALVCIFLFGGNDGNNTVVPLDAAGYQSYSSVRAGLTLAQSSLLPVNPPSPGRQFGLHANLKELQALFNQGNLCVLCNVGTLVGPMTKSQYNQSSAGRPLSLFSHADQQGQWQTSVSDQLTLTGWGGRTADGTMPLNGSNSFPMITSTSGVNLFATGVNSRPIVPGNNLAGFDTSAAATARYNALRQLLTTDSDATLVRSASDTMSQAIVNTQTLNTALGNAAAIQTAFPTSSIGNQMKQIAQIIAARGALGLSRQIFFASFGSFDTHSDQINTQGNLLLQLSQAMGAFYSATVELGVASQVTTFTLSDFGRTLKPASGGGSDHAWGSHHFIMGGGVKGGDFFGTYPNLALSGPDDISDEGRWLPSTSVDQYGATLATWYGLAASDLRTVFPNIGRFGTSNLGFLG